MTDQLLERIKAYHSGEMNHSEKLLFEMELKKDKELKELYDLYTTIEDGLADNVSEEEIELRKSLDKLSGQYTAYTGLETVLPVAANAPVSNLQEISKKRRTISARYLLVAAIFIAVLFAGILWYNTEGDKPVAIKTPAPASENKNIAVKENDQPDSNTNLQDVDAIPSKDPVKKPVNRDVLYANHFQPDAIPVHYSELLDHALQQYKNGSYKNTIASIDPDKIKTSLEELRPRGEVTEVMEKEERTTLFYAYYYRGISLMADQRFERSLADLQLALQYAPDKPSEIKTRWYISLIQLKLGNIIEARKQLERIVKSGDSQFSKKASDLLSDIK